ncbi:uncharacterized protein LOC123875603 isoform X2 [Maniola jurtina]|uniref:uncharacterized protein LOC123875603 isoform X2 n=1 Tax=Maniola jurtina TaxID=191418 RepID=UPI001E6894A9|nr:uncharacterized protein LOC123875603 isoform X2 [Maniola jurtina]XP_045777488.1 uncharacterized protein LOC123875603 isoform X2 [Maniola jurtina]
MPLPSKVKEQSRLLDLSSDEESDLQLEIIPNRKKKMTRKERNRSAVPKTSEPNIGQEVQCALCWAVRGTLLLWLLMLTWICAALYDQVTTMKFDIAKVSTSSAGVGDELQVCHTQAKELRTNASELSARLSKLELDFQELTKQMTQTAKELSAVSEQLSAAPKLADMPRRLAELQRTVADFGSQISGFDTSLTSAKKQATTATSGVDELKTLLSHLEGRTNETIANLTASSKKEDELKEQMTSLNTTLVSRIEGLQAKIDDMTKLSSTAAPVSSTTTAAPSAAPAPHALNATIPPGPAKPFVLQ